MNFVKTISSQDRSDAELVSEYRQTGSLQILGDLYQRYMELIYGVCLKYYKDSEKSRDAVMQIFEELIEKLKKHEVENFRSWLYQLAKNHCLMQLRSPRNMRTVEIPATLMQNEETVHLNGVLEREENFQRLEYCLSRLPDDQKKVIELFYLQGKCYNEIADSTGLEWNRVRSFIQNGRRNLKICMESKVIESSIKTDP